VARPMAPELLLAWLQRWNRQHPAEATAVPAQSGRSG
jgi:hypothetical protein